MKLLSLLFSTLLWAASAHATLNTEDAKHDAEGKIRALFEPLRQKYCLDECTTLGVDVNIKFSAQDTFAPGFEDTSSGDPVRLVPDGATIRLLMDSKVGPITRQNLLGLFQKHLDGSLEYPVRIDLITTKFPLPLGSAKRIADLREKISRQFKDTLEKIFMQYCNDACMLGDAQFKIETVNPEEAEYGSSSEIVQDGDTAVVVKEANATIFLDELLTVEERNAIIEMAKLRTSYLKNVTLKAMVIRFPHFEAYSEGRGASRGLSSKKGRGGKGELSTLEEKLLSKTENTSQTTAQTTSSDQKTATQQNSLNENNNKQERFERIETIERVEDGDAIQLELNRFKVFGLVFACSIIALLVFIAMAGRSGSTKMPSVLPAIQRVVQTLASDPLTDSTSRTPEPPLDRLPDASKSQGLGIRYEIQRLLDELQGIFAEHPKVAKIVFSRVLTEEGIETTSQYIAMFGESVMFDLLRDHSLQADLAELMEFYAKNPVEATDDERLELLKALHNRTVAAKMFVIGKRATTAFDFLVEMDHLQILELVKNESQTVKAIILTQCDTQKRAAIFSLIDETARVALLTELSRIDHLPRNYIYNVAAALKRKQKENPRLNTEALPGSDVLVTLLEKTPVAIQRQIIQSLEATNVDSARTVKTKLVSIETLPFLRDAHLLEVVMSLKHEELIHFLRGAATHIRETIFAKSPKDLILELEDQLKNAAASSSREAYQTVERKVLNRIKVMSNEGIINLLEINDRMFGEASPGMEMIESTKTGITKTKTNNPTMTKAAGW